MDARWKLPGGRRSVWGIGQGWQRLVMGQRLVTGRVLWPLAQQQSAGTRVRGRPRRTRWRLVRRPVACTISLSQGPLPHILPDPLDWAPVCCACLFSPGDVNPPLQRRANAKGRRQNLIGRGIRQFCDHAGDLLVMKRFVARIALKPLQAIHRP
jgi:hypothetical protein